MNEDAHLEAAYEDANGGTVDTAEYDDEESLESVPCSHLLFAGDRRMGVPPEYCDEPSEPGEEFCSKHLDDE